MAKIVTSDSVSLDGVVQDPAVDEGFGFVASHAGAARSDRPPEVADVKKNMKTIAVSVPISRTLQRAPGKIGARLGTFAEEQILQHEVIAVVEGCQGKEGDAE